tara:strand:+ start:480 stop:1022 length:543 start_codon:yes stop_codon:yes gene_type:complete
MGELQSLSERGELFISKKYSTTIDEQYVSFRPETHDFSVKVDDSYDEIDVEIKLSEYLNWGWPLFRILFKDGEELRVEYDSPEAGKIVEATFRLKDAYIFVNVRPDQTKIGELEWALKNCGKRSEVWKKFTNNFSNSLERINAPENRDILSVSWAFVWEDSPEGFQYWNKVNDKIKTIGK